MDQSDLYYFKPYSEEDRCNQNLDFAVICSFITQFGDKLDLQLNIEQLESSIENQTSIDESLIELHVKLLKKVRRYFVRDQWEKALTRFASEYSHEDAYEIEQLGYLKTRPSIKLQLLRRLLEAQFECDQKFKATVNLTEANELRNIPIGRDIKGNSYWKQTDGEGNLKIFQDQPLDYKSWKAVCTNTSELNNLINELVKIKDERVKGEPILEPYNPLPQIFPEFFIKDEKEEEKTPVQNERKISKTKKGRNKGRAKQTSPLPVLEEAKEEECSNIQMTVENGLNDCKGDKEESNINVPPKSPISTDSIESQVKATLENLINKVISSFEYFTKPLTRNCVDHSNIETEEKQEVPEAKSRKKQPKREKPKAEVLPRRTSSRIQQLQLKKIAEQEEQKKESSSRTMNCVASLDDNSRDSKRRSESPESDNKSCKKRRKRGESWRRGKGKKKLSWDKDDSDLSSASSLSESNDEFDETFEFNNINYDDEFACEEEETNTEPVIIKRARTARQSVGQDEPGSFNSSSVDEDKPCGRCDKSNDPEWILLCDMCDDGYHTSCCLPPLMIVPDGDWFCPPCEHKMLITKLEELYASVNEILEARERERQKRLKLRQNNTKRPKSEQNELPAKRSRDFLNELNDPLAVQALDRDLEQSADSETSYPHKEKLTKRKASRRAERTKSWNDRTGSLDKPRKPRKTYSRQNTLESDEESEELDDQLSESSEELRPKARRARASVSYRFQEYDELIASAIRGESYDEESSDKESKSSNCNYGRGKDMATIEALAYQQENGLMDQNGPTNAAEISLPPRRKPKKKSRRLNDLDAVSETENATSDESFQASSATEAEDEDEDLTETESYIESDATIDELVSSRNRKKRKKISYESDDSEYQPSRTRRAASQRVSYKESSDEDETDYARKSKKVNEESLSHSSDETTQASWRSSASNSDDEVSSPPVESAEEEELSDRSLVIAELTEMQSPLLENDTSKVKIESENQQLSTVDSINDSIDEIAAPLYPIKSDSIAPSLIPIGNASKTDQTTLTKMVHTELVRDPMEELNQYCSEGAGSATMFKSYNDILSAKNPPSDSTSFPTFYGDDF